MHQPPKSHLQGCADRFRKSLLLIAVSLLALSRPAIAQEASARNAGGPASVDELKKELALALDRLNKMQSCGLNYYVHGHNAKIQMEYSYLHGNTFADKSFSANRVWTQIQIMF